MRLTKTSEYALRALSLMAHDETLTFTADELHKQTQIPKKYLQRLLTQLAKANLIIGQRGRYGGFRLERSAKKIFLSEIIDAVEGERAAIGCFLGYAVCPLHSRCAMHDVWTETHKQTQRKLQKTTLAALSSRR